MTFMISDALPEDAMQYVVLVEEVIPIGSDDHHWQLVKTIPVQGDRTTADVRARELAMEHVPEGIYVRDGATVGRSVFRVSDRSWLVEVSPPTPTVRSWPGSPRPSRCTSRHTCRHRLTTPPRPLSAAFSPRLTASVTRQGRAERFS